MMIVVGMMKDAGVFHWLIRLFCSIKELSGLLLFILIMVFSFILSGLMGEVSSAMVMVTVIFDLCKVLTITPVPLIISSVLATNIGSASTVLGNPIGILIAARSGLSFEDFIIHALPLSVFILIVVIIVLCMWHRTYIKEMSSRIKECHNDQTIKSLHASITDGKAMMSISIFVLTVLSIGLHKRMETLFGLEDNNLLIMLPVFFAGIVMIYRHERARHYIEQEVDWYSLLFFMFLFAQAGVLQSSGVANTIAEKIVAGTGNNPQIILGTILLAGGILSSLLDNVVVVSSFIPVIQGLQIQHVNSASLWWALLFGACYGGNITMIGSTANIIALGLLEKEQEIRVAFFDWLKIGIVVGIISIIVSYSVMIVVPLY
jgi:Na+/H+ antiporter NhaD/arsenite permease-like protein